MKPIIIVNFKTYESAIGKKAVELAKLCDAQDCPVCVGASDIHLVSSSVCVPVYSQHVDSCGFGSHTGKILPEAVKENGAAGTLLNHSENRLSLHEIEAAIKRCKEVGLVTIVCANDAVQGEAIALFKPDFVAVEPPELIGGDVSVSTADPELIKESVDRITRHGVKVLVGAGVKTKEDIEKAVDLGAAGVLLASGVTKASDPSSVLAGFRE